MSHRGLGVSIHAPLQREGRPQRSQLNQPKFWFQSTPPSKERGDTALLQRCRASPMFQSTPPSKERGDGRARPAALARRCFNPRPPPKRGATGSIWTFLDLFLFQSTPPSKERGDSEIRRHGQVAR